MKVRDLLPKRRSKPTRNPSVDWSKHKDDLKVDFNHHCAYCGSYDGFRHTYFEVDHFIPKDFLRKIGSTIGLCYYVNLVYSCKFCNNNKKALWPSQSEINFNVNGEGFIDPCDENYDKHLKRTEKGGIIWNSPLGKWMATIAFKFDERDFSIKLLWEINQCRKTIELIVAELSNWHEGSAEYKGLLRQAEILSFKYFKLDKELIGYYNHL